MRTPRKITADCKSGLLYHNNINLFLSSWVIILYRAHMPFIVCLSIINSKIILTIFSPSVSLPLPHHPSFIPDPHLSLSAVVLHRYHLWLDVCLPRGPFKRVPNKLSELNALLWQSTRAFENCCSPENSPLDMQSYTAGRDHSFTSPLDDMFVQDNCQLNKQPLFQQKLITCSSPARNWDTPLPFPPANLMGFWSNPTLHLTAWVRSWSRMAFREETGLYWSTSRDIKHTGQSDT